VFHTYVLTAAKRSIDIGRAQFLMDKELAHKTALWVEANADAFPDPAPSTRDQAFWDHYCQRHLEKYGKPFEPDVSRDWS
jgi:hypothetical protein